METDHTVSDGQFSMGFYFCALAKVLATPGSFFKELRDDSGFGQSLGFLTVSAVFSTIAFLLTRPLVNPVMIGGIYFVNATGMTFISAGLGYVIMTMITGRKSTFLYFFRVYAYASSVVLLASWIPLFVWLTEPWKWVLIGIGLTNTCHLKWPTVVLIIVISISVIILFFWSLAPLILTG